MEELQKSLAVKRTELEKKNNEADKKLKKMMNNKQEAEKKKVDSEELKKILQVINYDLKFYKKIMLITELI